MCPSPRYMPSKYVYARFGMSAESAAFDSRKMNGRGGRIRTCKSLRTEGFKPSAYCQFRHAPVMVILTGCDWRHRRPCIEAAVGAARRRMEAAGGFEPPHRGFAVRSLNHLGTPPLGNRDSGL